MTYVCDSGSELRRLGGRKNRRAKMINGMNKKKENKKDQKYDVAIRK